MRSADSLNGQFNGGLSEVVLEWDCARITTSLGSQGIDSSKIGLTIEEARGLTQLMSDWKFSQVKRDRNQVANALALLARHCKHFCGLLHG